MYVMFFFKKNLVLIIVCCIKNILFIECIYLYYQISKPSLYNVLSPVPSYLYNFVLSSPTCPVTPLYYVVVRVPSGNKEKIIIIIIIIGLCIWTYLFCAL